MPARRLALFACFLVLLALARPPLGASLPQVVAQAQGEPELVVDLFGPALRYKTVPNSPVSAELSGPGGVKGQGLGFAGPDGWAQVQFFSPGAVIEPGDTLSLSRQGSNPLRLTVPLLAAGLDVAGDRVFGNAPPGSQVRVMVMAAGPGTESVERQVTAGAEGAFNLDLAGLADLQVGRASGLVTLSGADGQDFSLRLASLSAELTLGAATLRGRATAGQMVSVSLSRAAGGTEDLPAIRVGGGGTFSQRFDFLGIAPPAAGDRVRVQSAGGPAGSEEVREASLAALAIDLNPGRDEVLGVGPADTELEISAEDMDGQSARASVGTGPEGAFSLSLVDQVDLGPGWRVRASYEAAPGLRVGALAVLRKLRLGVHQLLSQGRAEPGQSITVTLRSATGAVKAVQQPWVDDQGDYELSFFGGLVELDSSPTVPEPGDVVEIAFVDGDPQLLYVPELSARPDLATKVIVGRAPPGTELRIRVEGPSGPVEVLAHADGSGAYQASLAGVMDLDRPASGSVSFDEGGGLALTTSWAAVRLTAALGNSFGGSFLAGNGPAWRQVRVQLLTPEGAIAGEGQSLVFGGNFVVVGGGLFTPQFFLTLTDRTGTPVDIRPGDRLRVQAGDDVFELLAPPLDAVIFVETDTVNGYSLPDSTVTLRVSGTGDAFEAEAETRTDGAGNFSHSFAGQYDIRHGAVVQLEIGVEGHQVLNTTLAPGLILFLDGSLLAGSLGPDAAAELSVQRAGVVLSSVRVTADAAGAFGALLTDARGEPLALQAGDLISLQPLQDGLDPLSLVVPELTVEADPATNTISGRATAGGSLTLLATEAYQRPGNLGLAQAWPAIGADHRYATDFVPSVAVRPGTRMLALYRPPAGHYVLREHTVPILNAEHSGPNACGYGEARQPVELQLQAAGGGLLASGRAQASGQGFFSTVLRAATGDPIAGAAGQTVAGLLGTTPAQVELPALDLTVNWGSGLITGQGPPDTSFTLGTAVPCPGQAPGAGLSIMVQIGFDQRTRPDGGFTAFMPPEILTPGAGLELAFFAPSGHRVFRHLYRSLGQVYIGQDRVAGQANPLEPLTLILRDAGGQERGRAEVQADAAGRFDARLSDAEGQPVASAAGDRVMLQAQAEAPEILVEPLSFDWAPGGVVPLVGQVPPDRNLRLVLRLADERQFAVALTSDSRGGFSFGAGDVPPRATWAWSDVAALRLVLSTPGGHQIIAQTPTFEAPPGPGPRPAAIYLPIAYTPREAATPGQAGPDLDLVGPARDLAGRAAAEAPVVRPADDPRPLDKAVPGYRGTVDPREVLADLWWLGPGAGLQLGGPTWPGKAGAVVPDWTVHSLKPER